MRLTPEELRACLNEIIGYFEIEYDILVQQVAHDLQENAGGFREVTVSSTNRRGRHFMCRVQCSAMAAVDGGRGAILLMEEVEPTKTS